MSLSPCFGFPVRLHRTSLLSLVPPPPLVVIRTRRYPYPVRFCAVLVPGLLLFFFPFSLPPRANKLTPTGFTDPRFFFFVPLRLGLHLSHPHSLFPGSVGFGPLLITLLYPPARLRVPQPAACSTGRDPSSPAWRVARPRRPPPPLGTPATSYVVMIFSPLLLVANFVSSWLGSQTV